MLTGAHPSALLTSTHSHLTTLAHTWKDRNKQKANTARFIDKQLNKQLKGKDKALECTGTCCLAYGEVIWQE